MKWIACAAMWVAVAFAIGVGIYITGKWGLLWFLIIPLYVTMTIDKMD